MIIQTLTLYNYAVFEGLQVIRPVHSSPDNDPNITLIGGMNGVGKTNLLDAVLLALFGKRSPSFTDSGLSYTAYLDGLINKNVPKDIGSWIELELRVPNDSSFDVLRVRRAWKKANVRITDEFIVWRNNEIDSILIKNWDTYTEELVPLGLAGLFFFDGEKIATLAESEETPASVQDAIRALLGLDLIDRLIIDLNGVIRKSSQNIAGSDIAASIGNLHDQADQLHLELAQNRQNEARLNTEIARKNKALTALKEEYIRQGGTLFDRRNDISLETEQLQSKLLQMRAELISLAGGDLPLVILLPVLRRIHTVALAEQTTSQTKIAMPFIKDFTNQLRSFLGAHLTGDDKKLIAILHYLNEKEDALAQSIHSTHTFDFSPLGLDQLTDLVSVSAQADCDRASRLLSAIGRSEEDLNRSEKLIQQEFDESTISSAINQIGELTSIIGSLTQEQSLLKEKTKSLLHEIKLLSNKTDRLAQQIVAHEEADRIVQYAVRSQESLRTFKEIVSASKVAQLTETITEAFGFLTRKTTLIDRITVDPNSLRISLFDASNLAVPKAKLSSGEKQMLSVAILWGLAKASGRKLPVIIDTPVGRLDSSHRMNFIANYLPNASHQVIVLSTDTEIVGPYLAPLTPSVGKFYLFEHEDQNQSTHIVEDSYFDMIGGSANGSETNPAFATR